MARTARACRAGEQVEGWRMIRNLLLAASIAAAPFALGAAIGLVAGFSF